MLIRTIEEIKQHLSVSNSVKFATISPSLDTVEREYLKKVIGQTMFDELQEYYDNGSPNNTEVQEDMFKLLSLSQAAVCNLAYWHGFDRLNVYIEEGGFKRTESDKFKGLFKYQEDNLKDYFKSTGFNCLDDVLEHLEAHPDSFQEFHASQTGKDLKGMFIPSTDLFDEIYFISRSRLIFMRLKPYMQIIEDLKIKTLLGPENYNFVRTEMQKQTPEEKVLSLLPLIRRPIAFYSSAMLMEESGAELGEKGLFFDGRMANNINDQNKTTAEASRVAELVKRNKALGDSFLAILKNYLLEHASDWNNFSTPKSGALNRDNRGKKIFVA